MFVGFFYALKEASIPVSITEFLTLLEAVDRGIASYRVQDFYYLSRAILVKDEQYFPAFEQVFSVCFQGALEQSNVLNPQNQAHHIPDEWLKKLMDRHFSEEEKKAIEGMGGFDELMKTLQKRLEEQKKRHQGGNKWIGTNGTSPFGAYGYHPEGIRIGQHQSIHRQAAKVWDQRFFSNLRDSQPLTSRTMKVALRHLRRWAREGARQELDLDGTISHTAHQGYLDVKFQPERRNTTKLLVLFDVGGSMDDHVLMCEELFSALRGEFKHLEFYYFHNYIYETLWKDMARRHETGVDTWDIIHRYDQDYRLIFVGDATMSPYEIIMAGGSNEHWNQESGQVWVQRLCRQFPSHAWLNPQPENRWHFYASIDLVKQDMKGRMYPLTIEGLIQASKKLKG